MTATKTEYTTRDGLRVYDLSPLTSELWTVAGPDGVDSTTIDPDALPSGFRWIDDQEWSVLVHGTKIGRAIARDVIADGMPREWTGLDPQDADQIPAGLADLADEIKNAARAAYLDAIRRA